MIPSANLELSKRLERCEGHACAMYAEAQRRIRPESGAEWMECDGTCAAFNGVASPVTQTFGLGIFQELSPATLDTIEQFFFERGAATEHEVSPFAGVAAIELLCHRGYRPIEISNVMYRRVERPENQARNNIETRVARSGEEKLWSDVIANGWLHEHPEFVDFFKENGAISSTCQDSVRFLAEYEGTVGAAGSLAIHGGVALLGGAATIPELRRLGLQTALIAARIQYAFDHGCDTLMVVVQPGSDSQRNAERNGFHVAYTRTKWRLAKPTPA